MSLHNQKMKCPACRSDQINKNGRRGTKQSYRCKACGRQFIESYASRGYSHDAKQICLNLYHNGMGFRAIERATGVSHNTVINWVRQEASTTLEVTEPLAVAESTEAIETTELEEWQAFSQAALQQCSVSSSVSSGQSSVAKQATAKSFRLRYVLHLAVNRLIKRSTSPSLALPGNAKRPLLQAWLSPLGRLNHYIIVQSAQAV